MSRCKHRVSRVGPRVTRRRFLQLAGGGLAWLTARPGRAATAGYRVGIGKLSDAYVATRRAVEACGEWPHAAIAGRKVVIKPNLVVPRTAETGTTTDPQVVRALVDLALEAGAAQVLLVDGGPQGANFSACGYDFFNGYDPAGRVALVDLSHASVVLAKVPGGGLAYTELYMPELLLANDVVFVSAAKLKTHIHTLATLTMKNLIGLTPAERYRIPPELWRFAMHRRGISQVIVDLNLVRPIDFAVVDGVIGMEGNGPTTGTPVRLDLVVAGRNPVAVDRVCLQATALPQTGVLHLAYAARRGLGPRDVAEVEMLGDSFVSHPAALPTLLAPILEYPQVVPFAFAPRFGQQTSITYSLNSPCQTRIEVVRTSELSPEETLIRTLRDWASLPAGVETLMWDGRDDDGQMAPPGRYTARVQARYSNIGTVAYATKPVLVTSEVVYLPALFKAARQAE
jgi:uncharacterized protein (DUF362 family)